MSTRHRWSSGSPAPSGAALVEAAKQAFVDGLGVAALAGAAVVAVAAAAAWRLLPRQLGAVTVPAAVPEAAGEDLALEPA